MWAATNKQNGKGDGCGKVYGEMGDLTGLECQRKEINGDEGEANKPEGRLQ